MTFNQGGTFLAPQSPSSPRPHNSRASFGLDLPSPFAARSPLGSKIPSHEANLFGQHYVASPMPGVDLACFCFEPSPGFSPGVGRVGMSPFAEFAAGLPTLCTPGLVKDGVVASPIMRLALRYEPCECDYREVMLHVYSEESPMNQCHSHPNPKKLFHSSTPAQNFGMR